MLWIEKYRPRRCEDVVGQERVMEHLRTFAATRNVPHLLVCGPHGTGKSAAVECFARQLYGEYWEENTTLLPAADLFEQGKRYLEDDERFGHLYRRELTLLANFKHVVKWYASLRPLGAEFKLMVFDGAEAITKDAQAALRRIMERYSATCRFVFVTTNPSAILPAISSRCLPLFFSPLPPERIEDTLRRILQQEAPDADLPGEDLALIVHAARGDLRMAILLLQIHVASGGAADLTEIAVSETDNVAASAFASVRSGDIAAAQKQVESLFIDYGLTAAEVLAALRRAVRREYNDPRLVERIAEADYRLTHGGNEYVQVNALLATMMEGVPH